MRVLSFDTSSFELHLSLLVDRQPVVERVVTPQTNERQDVAARVMPEIESAFDQAGWQREQLDAVVVGVGPGSFTGIRVAVITARTISQIFKIPCIGVSLLEALYAGSPSATSGEAAGIILPASSGQFFFAAYKALPDNPAASIIAPQCAPPELLEAALREADPSPAVCYFDETREPPVAGASFRPLRQLNNIATTQAQLVMDRVSLMGLKLETFAWQDVLPLYLRSPSVTLKKYATSIPPNESR